MARTTSNLAAALAAIATAAMLRACGSSSPRTQTRRTVALAAWLALVVAGCVPAIAACGSSNSSGTVTSPGPGIVNSRTYAAGVKYSDCMRAHGVPNFPDLGTNASYDYMAQVNQSAPAFESAQRECAKYGNPMAPPAPFPEAQMLGLVKLAQCMRTRGVPNFPDPTGNNIATHQLAVRLGIDPQSPAFGHAAVACGNPGMWGSSAPHAR